ncbi:metabolite traffic protein EboE [Roseiconus lacunae]|uniref:metabolite traffic protein EboE n=1 Tax=Roseiconus lacunae TaxID=2605694 RepID=UPI001F29541D|nr:metabolite traffic protein EboE [Roseiconus lacunae]
MNHLSRLRDHASLQVGYCTNVHAGTDLSSIRDNLSRYAVGVRERLVQLPMSLPGNRAKTASEDHRLGVGLWIPDQASRELVEGGLDDFANFLDRSRLSAFTINGFPFANFHGDRVKQGVYLPTWADRPRLEYTQRLATILAHLLPSGVDLGSISTLPIGWPDNPFVEESKRKIVTADAGRHLRELAVSLEELDRQTGKRIVVAIEPEPGCTLDTVGDMIAFFGDELPDSAHRRYITVCHDVCHSAVMNESQRDAIEAYAAAGITIGKVQVSSAIVADWKSIDREDRVAALDQLSGFAEDRYLHQTGQVSRDGGFRLATDLPELVRESSEASVDAADRWVIHFHVPIFLERFGHLRTTRNEVLACLDALGDPEIDVDFTGHLEVETYAWTVLPDQMRQRGLAEDIANELEWLLTQLGE